jgi:hypothetical protein
VTVSEFMFLAIGLALGVASGVALVEIIRARPPARREVRLTVARDAIPRRRASTLADDAFITVGPEPARGGPADRRDLDGMAPSGTPERRTNVLPAGPPPEFQDGARPAPGRVGMPISAGADPMLGAIRAGSRSNARPTGNAPGTADGAGATPARATRTPSTGPEQGADRTRTAVGLLDPPVTAAEAAQITRTYSGPCADERRLADERCELATRAQAQASAAADALRSAQRAYDTHSAAAEAAAEGADPRAVRSLKERAQRDFRAASKAAESEDAVEAAARTWLQAINRINREAAGLSLAVQRERDTAAEILARLERLSITADAARVGAEMAKSACVAARTAVADCDEGTQAGTEATRVTPTAPQATNPVLSDMAAEEALGIALEGGTAPRIFRLLRGDPEAMETLVATLAGDDPEEQRRWKLAVAGLLDAILADAIEGAFLRFPHDHAFWGPQNQQQNREITQALASLGYRFDGLGGWFDDRRPTQRELSLAMSYAGLDPMRVRHWPTEQQTAELFGEVEVAADEYLAGAAGDMTLAEMVELLGRRADSLVDLWNHWGRVRPLLLEER